MRQAEMEQLQAVLDTFDRLEDECYDRMAYMEEHNFNYEKQVIEIRRQAYHKCFRELQKTLTRQQVDEWTDADTATAKEIVAFFKDGTVKLQNDLNFYAAWLKHKLLKED